MSITDLNYLQVANETHLTGGIVFAGSSGTSLARGKNFAAACTSLYSSVYSARTRSSASSGSVSMAVAD